MNYFYVIIYICTATVSAVYETHVMPGWQTKRI